MSSTESSGAPAEGTSTPPASDAAFPSFGSTRGSGLARGKRPAAGPAASTAATSDYTPTAIEVVNAPREYQNPFAPADSSAEAAKVETPKPFEPAPFVITPAPVRAPRVQEAPAADLSAEASAKAEVAPVQNDEPVELNILEPAEQKTAPAQTWESEGFKPNREPRGDRGDRPRREERSERTERPADEPVDVDSIPPQFLYVRPGVTYVPTPRNWGGAPRERSERTERSDRPAAAHGSPARALETSAEVPAKSGGFLGWLKSLFGGSPAEPVAVSNGANDGYRREGGDRGQRRHRGGRNRGGQGGQGGGYSSGGEGRGGRSRGGRGRGRGEPEGSRQGGI